MCVQPWKVSLCPPKHLHTQIQAADMHTQLLLCFCTGEQGHNSYYHLRTCIAARNTYLPQNAERELIFCANILLEKENPWCIWLSCTFNSTPPALQSCCPPARCPWDPGRAAAGLQQTQSLFHTQEAREDRLAPVPSPGCWLVCFRAAPLQAL